MCSLFTALQWYLHWHRHTAISFLILLFMVLYEKNRVSSGLFPWFMDTKIYLLTAHIPKFNGSVQPVAEDAQTNYRVLLSLFWNVTQNTGGELGRTFSWANVEHSPMTVKSGFYRWDHLEMLQLYNLYCCRWKGTNSNLAYCKYFTETAVPIWFFEERNFRVRIF